MLRVDMQSDLLTVVALSAEIESRGAKINHFFDDTLSIAVKKGLESVVIANNNSKILIT